MTSASVDCRGRCPGAELERSPNVVGVVGVAGVTGLLTELLGREAWSRLRSDDKEPVSSDPTPPPSPSPLSVPAETFASGSMPATSSSLRHQDRAKVSSEASVRAADRATVPRHTTAKQPDVLLELAGTVEACGAAAAVTRPSAASTSREAPCADESKGTPPPTPPSPPPPNPATPPLASWLPALLPSAVGLLGPWRSSK
jgi:hypothetical protein